jgi:uncharacterized coiled-coil protein SlyX
MSDQRLNDLEIRFMEQDQKLAELSDMVSRQWDEIEALKRQLHRAKDRIISLEDALPDTNAIEKPPHY